MPHVEVELQRPLRLDEDAPPDSLAEVVVAIVALEEKRGPPDLVAPEPPILDRRYVVEGAELDAVRRSVAGPELRTQEVPEFAPTAAHIPGRPKHPERVDAQPDVGTELPVEQRAEDHGQALDTVERSARGERERRTGIGRAPRLLDAELTQPAADVRSGQGDLVAFDTVGQRLRVGVHFPADRRRRVADHGSAEDDKVAGDDGRGIEDGVAIDDEEAPRHASPEEDGAVPHRDVAAPLVPAGEARASHQSGRGGGIVPAHGILGDRMRQLVQPQD